MSTMRTTIRLLACAAALVAVGAAAAVTATGQFRASLTAATHSPTVSQRWTYVVSARTLKGRPLRASAHVQVFERGKRVNIIGWRQFKGTFKQSIRWAPSTRGHRYTFQTLLIATGANGKKAQLRLNYAVTPK
jgi:hypothetical protein